MRNFGIRFWTALALGTLATGTLTGKPVRGRPTPVFDIDVSLVGVTETSEGFVWKYEVCSTDASNRGLSHWIMSICGDPTVPRWDLEPPDVDYFDLRFFNFSGGKYFYTSENRNVYKVELGVDPTTGINGIKYEAVSGYELKDGLCDTFEFRLDTEFAIIDRTWGGKGATLLDFGTAGGPACAPDGPPPPPPPSPPFSSVPEPTSLALLGFGAVGGRALLRRRRR